MCHMWKIICKECGLEIAGKIYCKECLEKIVGLGIENEASQSEPVAQRPEPVRTEPARLNKQPEEMQYTNHKLKILKYHPPSRRASSKVPEIKQIQ